VTAFSRPTQRPGRAGALPRVLFMASAAAGVAFSGAIAWGHPILAAGWGPLWRLGLWTATWVVAVAAALRLPRKNALVLIIAAAVALRLAALAGPPTTSDDLYRYAWDGRVQLPGTDPYTSAPDAPRLAGLHDAWLWPNAAGCAALHRPAGCTRINRPAARTIYPPVAEAWFTLVYRLGGTGARHKAWQIAGLVTDLATIGLLVVALRRWGRDPRWVALYALSPFPVLEVVNNAHVDGLAIAFVIAALAVGAERRGSDAAHRLTRSEVGRDIAVGLLVGAAALVKLYPALLLAAVVALSATRPWRSLARAAGAAAGLAVLAYLPHVLSVGWRVVGYLPGYLKEEHYDRGGRFLLAGVVGLPGPATAALAAFGLLGAVGWVLWRRPAFPQGAAVLLAALFLTASPVQPWYACSLLAVASLTAWPWWAAVTVAGYPYFFAVILGYAHPVGLGRVCYGAALAVLLAGQWVRRRGQPTPRPLLLLPLPRHRTRAAPLTRRAPKSFPRPARPAIAHDPLQLQGPWACHSRGERPRGGSEP